MNKLVYLILTILLVMGIGCSSNQSTANADGETATYIESVDNNGIFDYVKIVDKETGCKYLAIENSGGGRSSLTSMFKSDGKPLCD